MGTGVRTSLPWSSPMRLEADLVGGCMSGRPQATKSNYGNQDTERLAQYTALSHPDASDRRVGADHARGRRGEALGCPIAEVKAVNLKWCMPRADAVSALANWPPMRRLNGPGHRRSKLRSEDFPVYRQGPGQHRRSADITTGSAQYGGDVRLAGNEVCVIGPSCGSAARWCRSTRRTP